MRKKSFIRFLIKKKLRILINLIVGNYPIYGKLLIKKILWIIMNWINRINKCQIMCKKLKNIKNYVCKEYNK